MLFLAIFLKSKMSNTIKNETSVQSDCEVVDQKIKRKFKGPGGRRIDSPGTQPKLFANSLNVVVLPNQTKKIPKKKKTSNDNEKPGVASKTPVLTSFFSPLNNTSNTKKESVASLTNEERETKLIMIYTNRAEHALNTFDKISLLKVIKDILKLSEKDIEKIANPFVKHVVKREFLNLKNIDSMKNMTTDEKKVYRKENHLKAKDNNEFEELIIQFLRGRREDMLCELKPFYDIPLIRLLGSNAACTLFSHCLSLTEFLNTFRELLGHELSFSAEYLMEQLKANKNGFQKCVGYILKAQLHWLVANGYKKNCKPLQSFVSRTYVPGVNGIFKLTQLVLLDEVYSEGTDDSQENPKEGDITIGSRFSIGYDANVGHAMQQLEDLPFFWNLAISSQVTIMELLMEKILDSVCFRRYLESSKEIRSRAMQEKKDIEDTMQKVQKDIEEIESHCLDDEISRLTRRQTRELAESEKLKNKKASELELLRDKLLEQDENIQEAELISNYGQVKPLGYDRFYRRYWFFGNSPNRGIFVEQEATNYDKNLSVNAVGQEKARSENTDGNAKPKSDFDTFLNTLSENLFGRPPSNSPNSKAQWRIIKTESELNLLLDCLGKGVREVKLAAAIRRSLHKILDSLKENTQAKDEDVQIIALDDLSKPISNIKDKLV